MTAMPRREFLWHALAACASAALAPVSPVSAVQSGPVDRAATVGAGYFGAQGDAVRAVGEAYLRQLGRDTSRDAVVAAARGALDAIDRSRDQAGAIRALVRAVREDFERGRTVQVEGWILSRTEAEICALTLLGA
jgi:hypothetical protein